MGGKRKAKQGKFGEETDEERWEDCMIWGNFSEAEQWGSLIMRIGYYAISNCQ